jgi:hypothetical protein
MFHFRNEPGFAITIQKNTAPYTVESTRTVRKITAYGFESSREDSEGETRPAPVVSVSFDHDDDTATHLYVDEETLAVLVGAMTDIRDEMNG